MIVFCDSKRKLLIFYLRMRDLIGELTRVLKIVYGVFSIFSYKTSGIAYKKSSCTVPRIGLKIKFLKIHLKNAFQHFFSISLVKVRFERTLNRFYTHSGSQWNRFFLSCKSCILSNLFKSVVRVTVHENSCIPVL